jgi:hypothetical protein
MKRIRLTQRKWAKVDNADFKHLNQFAWHYVQPPSDGHGGKQGYARRALPRKKGQKLKFIYMHQQIMGCKNADHINGDKLDNRRSNLREAHRQGNSANRPKAKFKRAPTSRFKGVNYVAKYKSWYASIRVNDKYIYLGYYHDEEVAARAYDMGALRYFKEFAHTNFPKSDYGWKAA